MTREGRAVSFVVLRPDPEAREDAGVRGRRTGADARPGRPELLAVRRPDDDEDLPGLWGLPAASLRAGESWEDAVRRAGREKLGVELEGLRVLEEGTAERPGGPLRMRLFGARIGSGRPDVARPGAPDDATTRYAEWAWAPPERLEEAARKGSLCSRLCLRHLARG